MFHPKYLFLIVLFPLFSTFLFLTMMQNGLPQALPIAVIDQDNSATSRRIIRQLDNYKQTDVTARVPNFQEAQELLKKGDVYAMLSIPPKFEQELLSFRQPTITYYLNGAFIVANSLLFKDQKTLSIVSNAAVNLELRKAKGEREEQIMADLQPIYIDTHALGNPLINYAIYLCSIILPGIVGILIMLTTQYTLGNEIKRESCKRLLSMAHNNIRTMLSGKMLPYTLLYWLVLSCIDVILYKFMEYPCQNGLLTIMIGGLLYIVACQSLSLIIFSLFPSMQISLSIIALISVLSLSMSGFTFPVSEMNPLLQTMAELFPLRHYFLFYVDNCLNGVPLQYSWQSVAALIGFPLLGLLASIPIKNAYQNCSK
ncbi:MAG: ABC transporter permease [Paludibacteraceae bacterium]|nr:ABC transporter permease [Paludibacteraceae bacterium]